MIEWAAFRAVKLGGTANAYKAFVPLLGAGVFLFFKMKVPQKCKSNIKKERNVSCHQMKSGSVMNTKKEKQGYFGDYGGIYVPDSLKGAVTEIASAYQEAKADEKFWLEFEHLLLNYAGRPSLLYFAEGLSRVLGGAKIYLKREDLNHTGAHKINNVLGQALLAKRMGKKKLIAETGAGQHGVATATAAALMGMECQVYMGYHDAQRQALNVFRMELLGAKVHRVKEGTMTLKDAVDAALVAWSENSEDTFYLLGSVVGPHPYPEMVRDFQRVIGREARAQILEAEGRLPNKVIACVGGGSNAIGLFYDFLNDPDVELYGVEAAGKGLDTLEHAATLTLGQPATFHGMYTYFNLNDKGELAPVYSISAGLDYPGVGPEHAFLKDSGRAFYTSITDGEALSAFYLLSRIEGIIPAIESSHALAYAFKIAPNLPKEEIIIVNLSGRGDKDVEQIADYQKRIKKEEERN